MKKILACLMTLVLLCSFLFTASAESGDLTFELLEDGSGYMITSCDSKTLAVTIPAAYEGLPVKAVADSAFTGCRMLRKFEVEEGNEFFYAEDGLLYTDAPVKTLVRFPNCKGERGYAYQLPEGTVAIAPWAFSGCTNLEFLHIPEGVTTVGDCAFANVEAPFNMDIFFPATIKKIGENLLQNQKDNVVFNIKGNTPVVGYARKNKIPYTLIKDKKPVKQTAQVHEPDLADAGVTELPDPETRVEYPVPTAYKFMADVCAEHYDLAKYQAGDPSEVLIPMAKRWPMLLPDEEGKTVNGDAPIEGLYGIGYTETETILRGYDAEGNITGTRRVNGDFGFALPGAVSMGVSGGKGTAVSIVPYEPVFVSGSGVIPVSPEAFRKGSGESVIIYALEFGSADYSPEMHASLNVLGSCITDTYGKQEDTSTHYSTLILSLRDPYLQDKMDQYTLHFHGLDKKFENEKMILWVSSEYDKIEKDFGDKMWGLYSKVAETMDGTYVPQGSELNKVSILLSSSHPSVTSTDGGLSIVMLDRNSIPFRKGATTDAHEFVHAVDWSFGIMHNVFIPRAWTEGRAEWIGTQVSKAMKLSTTNPYPAKYNWSFLTEEDKADFYRYYFENGNNDVVYPLGYFFIKYLCETYGEDVNAKIMDNIIHSDMNQDNAMEVFKECVTSVTDPDVFQNFVRDVIG